MQLKSRGFFSILLVLILVLTTIPPVFAAENSRFFPETGKTVSGKFLEYWQKNGGLPVYGYPITEAQNEVDPETGKTFLIQWFERNRFEYHPENAGTKYEVLLGLLGKDLRRDALSIDPAFRIAGALVDPTGPKDQQWYLPETGHNLRYGFLKYWQTNGGLERFGYPISEEHQEIDPETGKLFTTQWFERARFEYHPENQAPYDILLGLLGNQLKKNTGQYKFAWKVGGSYNLFFRPAAIAIDGLNLYVADVLNQRLLVYSTYAKYGGMGNIKGNWGSQGSGDGQFNFSSNAGLAVDAQGNAFVADSSNRVQKFDRDGQFLLKWGSYGTQTGQFSGPAQMAVDAQSNVFVADSGNHRVQKFDNNGKYLASFGTTDTLTKPTGIAVNTAGEVYVADAGQAKILKFSTTGQLISSWNFYNNAQSQINSTASGPYAAFSLALSPAQDKVYVADAEGRNIKIFSPDGKTSIASNFEKSGSQYGLPASIAVDPRGDVFVASYFNFQVQRYFFDGTYKATAGNNFNSPGTFNPDATGGPNDVAVNRQGNLYVADIGNHRIQKFDAKGIYQFSFGSKGSGDGQFDFSTSSAGPHIAIDWLGYIYVTDPGNYRVEKFSSSGEFITKWGSKGTGNGQFGDFNWPGGPAGITVDNQGNVYVVDTGNPRIQKFDSNGNFLMTWGSTGISDGQFAGPVGIAADSQNNIFVVDNFRTQKFDQDGHFMSKFGNGGRGISTDFFGGSDGVYISGNSNGRIWKFDRNGKYLLEFSGPGNGDGLLNFANGLAIGQGGLNVYVADTRNNRLVSFQNY